MIAHTLCQVHNTTISPANASTLYMHTVLWGSRAGLLNTKQAMHVCGQGAAEQQQQQPAEVHRINYCLQSWTTNAHFLEQKWT